MAVKVYHHRILHRAAMNNFLSKDNFLITIFQNCIYYTFRYPLLILVEVLKHFSTVLYGQFMVE